MKSETPLSKHEIKTLSDFRYQLRRFLHISEELTAAAGITNLQYLVLLHIKGMPERDWATITELAQRLLSKHHGVVALIDRCERLQLLERRPGRQDRREVEVHLTAKGQRLVQRLARLHRDELVRLEGVFAVPVPGRLAPQGAGA
jgi:DNA-binding MarR family transcriptional regulator